MRKKQKKVLNCLVCGDDISNLKSKDVTCSEDCHQVHRKRYQAAWFQLNKDSQRKKMREYKRKWRADKKAKAEKEARGLDL